MPAIPLHTAVSYVAGAYLVFFALVLIYVAIMASKLSRIETELSELTELALTQRAGAGTPPADATQTPPADAPPAQAPQTGATKANVAQTDAPAAEAVAR
jgi:hypothetical protein